MENIEKDRLSVYEIGYLIASSIPAEKVEEESSNIQKIVTDAGGSLIAQGETHLEQLAYTIRRKTVSGSYEKFDSAYFGWVKFELGSDKIEAIKKTLEVHPSIIRMLLITTTRENTYLGKRASVVAAAMSPKRAGEAEPAPEEKKEAAPVSIEEMDKSIDEMVKEV